MKEPFGSETQVRYTLLKIPFLIFLISSLNLFPALRYGLSTYPKNTGVTVCYKIKSSSRQDYMQWELQEWRILHRQVGDSHFHSGSFSMLSKTPTG